MRVAGDRGEIRCADTTSGRTRRTSYNEKERAGGHAQHRRPDIGNLGQSLGTQSPADRLWRKRCGDQPRCVIEVGGGRSRIDSGDADADLQVQRRRRLEFRSIRASNNRFEAKLELVGRPTEKGRNSFRGGAGPSVLLFMALR